MRSAVALSVAVGALAAACGSVLLLEPEDRISIWRGAFLSASGLAFFLSLFDFLNGVALDSSVTRKYQLSMADVLDISNKVVSAVQAGLSCITGTIVCLWSCTRNFLHSSHFMSEAYAWFGAAYFFYDIWSMYKVHEKVVPEDGVKRRMSFFAYCRKQPIIIMHHLFIGGFGFLVIVYLRGGLGDCVFGFVYLMELSTPFVSLRSILSKLKMKSTQLYVVNGVLMLATFFVCRILIMPYLCFLYSRTIGLPYWEAIDGLPTGCKISISILLFPQFYWFYLMVSGATKVFCRKTES